MGDCERLFGWDSINVNRLDSSYHKIAKCSIVVTRKQLKLFQTHVPCRFKCKNIELLDINDC